MTNLYIYTYQHDYIFSWFLYSNEIGTWNSISSHFQIHGDARVCFSNNRKDTPSLLFPVCPCEIREYSAPQQGVFTSSSTFYEFVKMKRANPSFPPPLIDANERTFSPLDRDLYTMILQEIFLSKNPPRGRLLDSRSNFSLHFLFPLSLLSSCFRLPREQQDHSNRGERNFRVAMI